MSNYENFKKFEQLKLLLKRSYIRLPEGKIKEIMNSLNPEGEIVILQIPEKRIFELMSRNVKIKNEIILKKGVLGSTKITKVEDFIFEQNFEKVIWISDSDSEKNLKIGELNLKNDVVISHKTTTSEAKEMVLLFNVKIARKYLYDVGDEFVKYQLVLIYKDLSDANYLKADYPAVEFLKDVKEKYDEKATFVKAFLDTNAFVVNAITNDISFFNFFKKDLFVNNDLYIEEGFLKKILDIQYSTSSNIIETNTGNIVRVYNSSEQILIDNSMLSNITGNSVQKCVEANNIKHIKVRFKGDAKHKITGLVNIEYNPKQGEKSTNERIPNKYEKIVKKILSKTIT